MYIGLHVKYGLFLLDLMKLEFFYILPNFFTIRPVGAELLHADRQTDGHVKISTSHFVISREVTKKRDSLLGECTKTENKSQEHQYGSRRLRLPDVMTIAHEGGKVVSCTHRPILPSRKYTWYSFLSDASSTQGP